MNRDSVVELIRQKISKSIYDLGLDIDFAIADERMFTPEDKKDLYFVVKFGQGQVNFAIADIPVTIQCVSNSNEVDSLMDVLWKFLEDNNYKTFNGITLAFLSPQITGNFNEIFDGYRALVYVAGNVRVPNSSKAQAVNIIRYREDSTNTDITDFVSCHINYSTQPDPQSFTDSSGLAKSLNRQKVISIVVSMYLNSDTNNKLMNVAKNVLNGAVNYDMNKIITLGLFSDSNAVLDMNNWIITDISIPQELGAYPLVSITLTRA